MWEDIWSKLCTSERQTIDVRWAGVIRNATLQNVEKKPVTFADKLDYIQLWYNLQQISGGQRVSDQSIQYGVTD